MQLRVGLLVVVIFLLDQLSKWAVLRWLKPVGSIEMPGGFWALTYSENTGGAFSFLRGHNTVFIVCGILISLGLVYLIATSEDLTTVHGWAFGLLLGGAAGNLLDRIRHSFVVDFIDFKVWPVFNIADSGISVGIALLLWLMITEKEPEDQAAREVAAS